MSDASALRERRTKARPPGRIEVTVRDTLLLAFVAAAGHASTKHLEIAFELSGDVARRRMRALRSHRLVAARVPHDDPREPNWHSVTPAGIEHLAERGHLDPTRYVRPRSSLPEHLDHLEGSVFLHAALAAATTRTEGTVALRLYEYERVIRARGATEGATVPDAVAVLDAQMARKATMIEIDRGTENPNTLRRKAERYVEARQARPRAYGTDDWSVLVVVPSERRLRRLLEAFAGVDAPSGFLAVALRAWISDRSVLTPCAMALEAEPGRGVQAVHVAPFAPCRDCGRDEDGPRSSTAGPSGRHNGQDGAS